MIILGIILIPLSIAICAFVVALGIGRIRERVRTRRHTGHYATAVESVGAHRAIPPTQAGFDTVEAARDAVSGELDARGIVGGSRGVIYAQRTDGRWDAIEEVG